MKINSKTYTLIIITFLLFTTQYTHATLKQSPYAGDDEHKTSPSISSENFPGSFNIGIGIIPFSFLGLAPSATLRQLFLTSENVFGLGLRASVPATLKLLDFSSSSTAFLLGVTGQLDIIFWRRLLLSGTIQYHHFFNGSDGLSLGGGIEFFFTGKCHSSSGLSLQGMFVIGAASHISAHLNIWITATNSFQLGFRHYFSDGYSNPFREQTLITLTNTIRIGW